MATKTFDELIAGATAIKNNELPESNTHTLVGGQLLEMANKHKESDQQSDVINVTTKFPLAAGSYYTSLTARAAVIAEYRKLGKKLLYKTDATTWVEEKFIGSAITDTIWNAAANWQGVASKNDINQLGANLNNIKYNISNITKTSDITPATHYKENYYISAGLYSLAIGSMQAYNGAYIDKIEIIGNMKLSFACPKTTNVIAAAYYDENGIFVECIANANESAVDIDVMLQADKGKYVYICYVNNNYTKYKVSEYELSYINVNEIEVNVTNANANASDALALASGLNEIIDPYFVDKQISVTNRIIDSDTIINTTAYWGQKYLNINQLIISKIIYKTSKTSSLNKIVILDANKKVISITSINDAVIGVNTITGLSIILPPNGTVIIIGCDMAKKGNELPNIIPSVNRYINADSCSVGDTLSSAQNLTTYMLSLEIYTSAKALEVPCNDAQLDDAIEAKLNNNTSVQKNYLENKKIIGIGDSAMRGHSLDITKTWIAKIANRCGMTYVNHGVNGVNLSYVTSGTYTADLSVVAQSQEVEIDADIILIQAGGNDASRSIAIGTEDSTDNTTFMGALNEILERLQTNFPTKKIGFVSQYHYANSIIPNYVTYFEAIKTICARHCIPVLDLYNNSGIDFNNTTQCNALLIDVYHFNEVGMEFISYKIEQFLRSL